MKTLHRSTCVLGLTAVLLCGCRQTSSDKVQGYIEGEFVYMASPLAGALEKLSVQRGQQVKKGDPLFALDCVAETAARDEAARRLAQACATLEDAKKGKRPSEIESLEAQIKSTRAALTFSERELQRQEGLVKSGATSVNDIDRARSSNDQNTHQLEQLQADLKTAQLGMRSDQIAALEADVRAREASLAKAAWDLSQKRQESPVSGQVFDTLYRQGEWVAAGKPVVALLPPPNVKLRAFVPQAWAGRIQAGNKVLIYVDGVSQPYAGTVSFISPQTEYTPPVIYSRENRDKLVFMIEARFESEIAIKLHPGQPVDVKVEDSNGVTLTHE